MKNLANCKPTEFLRQTNRIRKYVAQWLDMTGILDIRKDMPEVDKTVSPTSLAVQKTGNSPRGVSRS